MRGIASRPNAAWCLLLLWTTSLKPCHCGDCDFTESYDAVVTVSVKEPVHVTNFKWCWNVPPRCPDSKLEYRIVYKNITVPKSRVVKRCCKDQIQLYDECVPECNEDRCPNVQCAPGTDKCKCKPGFMGPMCRKKCNVGFWGMSCKNTCNLACADCDHRTGCCKTPATDNFVIVAGLTFCATSNTASQNSIPENSTEHDENNENERTTRSRVRIAELTTLEPVAHGPVETISEAPPVLTETPVKTQNPVTLVPTHRSIFEDVTVEENTLPSSSPPSKKKLQRDGFVGTVTKVEVMVYKYDELVKKLLWISAMTVIAIAVVFVIMFVMFLNYYGVTKLNDRCRSASKPAKKLNETYISTQNLGHVPPNRYTKPPTLCSRNDDGLPIHPDIFCPVFSAPHSINGSSIYDSPQPLYEILN